MGGRPHEVIGRLLGPGAPELTCEQCFDELDHFVDLELTGGDAEARVAGMRAHLLGCSACAGDYESLRELVSRGAAGA
jgi:hypothetical protein